MALSKPYTSKDVASVVERWQPCQIFVMGNAEPFITISHHELYKPGSWARCSPEALAKLKTAIEQVYAQGVREIGVLAPKIIQDEILKLALSITNDTEWKVYPLFELSYTKGLLETKEKIFNEALIEAEIDAEEAELDQARKEVCDIMGFTEEVIDELLKFADEQDVKKLPEHLRKLFADGK